MIPKRPFIIGCEAVINEMKAVAPEDPAGYQTIDAGLHLRPETLKKELQDAVDRADGKNDAIILGFGLCSNAVIGLKSRHSTLIVPRVDDCIAMLLGSQARYKKELAKEPGTYFLSKGWIDAGVTLVNELHDMTKRFGRDRAHKLMKKMLEHYTRLAYLNLENGDQNYYKTFTRNAARELGLAYSEIKGTTALLKAMIAGDWDASFVVAPPGKTICFADFKSFNPSTQ
jgi:hypothetical protein